VLVSRTVRDHVRDKLGFAFEDMGEQEWQPPRLPLE
jgi:hypothetical protein